MKGAPLAARIREEVANDVAELGQVGLATVLVGDDPASHIYVSHKHKAALDAGIESHDHRLSDETSPDELREVIEQLNENDRVDGILVQLPLPKHLDGTAATRLVSPAKDVDGFHPVSAGQLYLGHPTFVPATPAGIMELLDEHEVELEGRRAVVVGRSQIVGKPMAHLLLGRNATVTICHSRTVDLAAHTRAADVLVAGVGHPHLITADMVKRGRGRRRRRYHPPAGRARGRRPSGRRGGRRPPDAGARRRRPDDHRNPASQHGFGRSLPTGDPCVSVAASGKFRVARDSS